VDSGSTDGSVERAKREGVSVVELEVPPNFTAARARNSGLVKLLAESPDLEFVQMVDGDCEIHQDWIAAGLAALRAEPDLAAVYGRLRERFPTRSVYNALCDDDWNAPIGEATIVGGIALFRVSAIRQVDFYEPTISPAKNRTCPCACEKVVGVYAESMRRWGFTMRISLDSPSGGSALGGQDTPTENWRIAIRMLAARIGPIRLIASCFGGA